MTSLWQRPTPEAYLFGFADSYQGSRKRPAFLMGEISDTGWPHETWIANRPEDFASGFLECWKVARGHDATTS